MEWNDEAIVLGLRRHGETSVIMECMTAEHGRHLGLVRGGCSRRLRPVLQVGNRIDVTWRARLDEHLGTFQVEALDLSASDFMADRPSLEAMQTICAHLRLLPERDPHKRLFEMAKLLADLTGDIRSTAELLVRFEMRLLDELGFGLDLKSCAATGRTAQLVYVSPKSGRAVSAEAGEPWKDKMLKLPEFLTGDRDRRPDREGLQSGFHLAGFFLHRDVWQPRDLGEPESRQAFLKLLLTN